MCTPSYRVLLLGLGNTILSDDGVGVYAVRCARQFLGAREPIDVKEAELGGFALLDLLEGYRACVIIDAVKWPDRAPGTIQVLDAVPFQPTTRLAAVHQIDLPTALELGRSLARPMPRDVAIVAVQVDDPYLLGETCSPHVAAAIEPAAKRAVSLARKLLTANTVR